jgi:RNA polymerase sigma-70 factor (ECF subfamily)
LVSETSTAASRGKEGSLLPATGFEAESFEYFYDEHFANVSRAMCALVGPDDAFDMTQEAFLRTWSKWSRVGNMRDPSSYVLKTAMNLSRSHWRRAATLKRLLHLISRSEVARELEVELDVLEAVRRLPPQQRRVFVLRAIAECSTDEIATLLQMEASTVRVHLSRGRATLRRSIADDLRANGVVKVDGGGGGHAEFHR